MIRKILSTLLNGKAMTPAVWARLILTTTQPSNKIIFCEWFRLQTFVLRDTTLSHWRTKLQCNFQDEIQPGVSHSSLLRHMDELGLCKWVLTKKYKILTEYMFWMFVRVKLRVFKLSFSMCVLFSPWTRGKLLSQMVQNQSPTYKNYELHHSAWRHLSHHSCSVSVPAVSHSIELSHKST